MRAQTTARDAEVKYWLPFKLGWVKQDDAKVWPGDELVDEMERKWRVVLATEDVDRSVQGGAFYARYLCLRVASISTIVPVPRRPIWGMCPWKKWRGLEFIRIS